MNDKIIFGFLIGLFSPLFFMPVIVWIVNFLYSNIFLSLFETLSLIRNLDSVDYPSLISLSLIINLIFFLSILKFSKSNFSMYYARGILFSTFLYGMVILVLKF